METPKTAEEIVTGIDFPLLKEQKKALLEVIENTDDVPRLEKLEGIVNLLNEIQDYAVDVLGMDENEVFDLTNDDDETESPWVEIHNDFEDEGNIHIDAWTTEDGDEGGKVIAKINTTTKEVEYLDERAKTDRFAQENIQEVLDNL
jgi:hypothetical protein